MAYDSKYKTGESHCVSPVCISESCWMLLSKYLLLYSVKTLRFDNTQNMYNRYFIIKGRQLSDNTILNRKSYGCKQQYKQVMPKSICFFMQAIRWIGVIKTI